MVYEEIQHLVTQANNQLPRHKLQFGDMVANPQQVAENKQPRTHKPPKKQLASKTYEADRFLQGSITGIFVYNKQLT
jgi:hypothetical protein